MMRLQMPPYLNSQRIILPAILFAIVFIAFLNKPFRKEKKNSAVDYVGTFFLFIWIPTSFLN